MPAFLPLNLGEIFLIAVVAVVVFGRDLPRVVMEVAQWVYKARRSLADLRRETGIDAELREFDRTIRQTARDTHKAFEQKALRASGWEEATTLEESGVEGARDGDSSDGVAEEPVAGDPAAEEPAPGSERPEGEKPIDTAPGSTGTDPAEAAEDELNPSRPPR